MDARLAVVAAVVVLSGCGAVVDDAGSAPGIEETLTPAPVPEPTPEPVTLPPGVASDSVPNANALFGAHTRYLDGKSYALDVRVGADDQESRHVFRIESELRYYRYDRLAGYPQNVTSFADGETVYVRSELFNDSRYATSNVTGSPSFHTVRLANVFFRLDEATVTRTQADGDPHYRVRARTDDHPRLDSARDFRLRALVTPDGFIRSMRVDYVLVGNGEPTNVTRQFEYSDVGSTTVDRPEWVRERWDANGTAGPGPTAATAGE